MNIEQIETFLDLCETRSFNQTAERLGVTQSTVSGRVRGLEKALNCRLLERSRAGTELTTEGLRFEPHARTLRLAWRDGVHDALGAGNAARTARIGFQPDLLGDRVADWVTVLQAAMPQTALYVEADYSTQMCADVASGEQDLAILYTPKPQPDLHFETLGEVDYVMVSTVAGQLSEVRSDNYILAQFSPAFSATHAALLPELSMVAVSSGQNAVVRGLLSAFGGSTYLLRQTAAELVGSGLAHRVVDAPAISQPVFGCVHLRNRHRRPYRAALSALRGHLDVGSG